MEAMILRFCKLSYLVQHLWCIDPGCSCHMSIFLHLCRRVHTKRRWGTSKQMVGMTYCQSSLCQGDVIECVHANAITIPSALYALSVHSWLAMILVYLDVYPNESNINTPKIAIYFQKLHNLVLDDLIYSMWKNHIDTTLW